MSLRRELYDLLAKIPGGDPVVRIMTTSQHLDSLPPEEVDRAERRMLALARAMSDGVSMDPKITLDEFFVRVDAIERGLIN